MLMRGVIVYLIHHRDNIDKMITLDINDKNDFEWLSKVKIVWNEPDSGDLMRPDGPVV
jgi:gluconate kinase